MMTFCFNHCLNEVECEENINLVLYLEPHNNQK